ncbi:iron-containing redox enzyme family protein [Glacieibacterium sp.]|uniref:iron-containing redox enzyme family protein n=1 Tax=Glacieibacterium sp. TaxID=2860237 RepID=UPI003AFFA177
MLTPIETARAPARAAEIRRLDDWRASGFQQRLSRFNRERLATAIPEGDWEAVLDDETAMRKLEGRWIDAERGVVAGRAALAPTDPQAFIGWFEDLLASGPGQGDPLFPWLAEHATLDEMRWFLQQEVAGEAGFDDLVALTQVKLPDRAKMELARNYWDEMGRGNMAGMHGPMLNALAERLDVRAEIETTVPESLALANTMVAFATARRTVWHSVGALGVIELTAPARSAAVAAGLRRLGYSDKDRRYFDLHAVLDVKHSAAWNAEALIPIVTEFPEVARYLAEGALMRLECGARCFARYRSELWERKRAAA